MSLGDLLQAVSIKYIRYLWRCKWLIAIVALMGGGYWFLYGMGVGNNLYGIDRIHGK